MVNTRKAMLVGAVIGFGSGLFISGITISILFYTLGSTIKSGELPVSINQQYSVTTFEKTDANVQDARDIDNIDNIPNTDTVDNIAEVEVIDTTLNIKKELEQTQAVEIKIPSNSTATKITELLEEKGVVEDSQDLLAYIKSKNKTRDIISGTKIFPLNSDLEKILEILLARN